MHEGQHLAGGHDDIIADIAAIEDRDAARVDIEPVAEAPADFAHAHVADGQMFGVGT